MIFDKLLVYDQDRALVKELGLKNWEGFPSHSGTHDVGTVKVSGGEVRILVGGMPALYFEFLITDREGGREYTASTGTGSLSTYWPIAKALAENMFVIKKLDELPQEQCL